MKKYVNPSLSLIEIAKEDVMSTSVVIEAFNDGEDAYVNDVDWD